MTERSLVNYTIEDRIAVVTIDHPPMNALDMDTRLALYEAFGELAGNLDEVRVVILRGKGEKAFAAGADIKAFMELTPDNTMPRLTRTHEIFGAIENFERPVIAAIHGFCLGGGLELALACDIRYSSKDAKFGFPEVNLSVFPGNGGTARALHYLPIGRFKEMVYSGAMIGAEEALSYGLIEKVVDRGRSMEAAMELARAIAKRGPLGVAAAKKVINLARNVQLEQCLKTESEHWTALTAFEDMKEGAQAFLEKRKPVFRGR